MVTTMETTDGVTRTGLPASQGGWGAIITKGGEQGNGDAYAPANNGAGANARYRRARLQLRDQPPVGRDRQGLRPGFCAMGSNGVGGYMGVGDHWISTAAGTPASTYYTLWNTNDKVGLPIRRGRSSTRPVRCSRARPGTTPANTLAPQPARSPAASHSGCDAYHNAWWTIPTGNLGSGTYVLQVQTSKTSAAQRQYRCECQRQHRAPRTCGRSRRLVEARRRSTATAG